MEIIMDMEIIQDISIIVQLRVEEYIYIIKCIIYTLMNFMNSC